MSSSAICKQLRRASLLGACAALFAGAAHAASPPDLNGIWVIAGSFMDRQDGTFLAAPGRAEANEREGKSFFSSMPKLKGEYAKRLAAVTEAEAKGAPTEDRTADCLPPGMPQFWGGPYAFEILQNAKQINFFQEGLTMTRRIYLDGRRHPSLDDVDPLNLGHSVGHWEGDVLVIDTTNFAPDTPLVGSGTSHSDKMHILERIHLVGPDMLEIRTTVEDPDALQEPWVTTRKLHRKPGMEIHDYICAENNRNRTANGVTQVILNTK